MLFSSKDSKALEALQNTHNALQNEVSLLKNENANYRQTISAFVGVKSGYEHQLAAMEKKHSQDVLALKNELEQERKSVNRKVNKALADIGVKQFAPEEIGRSNSDSSPSGIYSKFMSLSGAEKDTFFRANEKVITGFVKGAV